MVTQIGDGGSGGVTEDLTEESLLRVTTEMREKIGDQIWYGRDK
jgi:hypothetical protein